MSPSGAKKVRNLEANIVICSCGRTQYEINQVIKQRENAKLFYTPRDGALTVIISKDGTVKANSWSF